MTQVKVYNQDGNVAGEVEAPIFLSAKWNPSLVHQVFKAMAANLRRPTAHTKDRSEVSGGGKKPWKQKGTGRARQGSTRSPLWRHGGVSHGPRNERNYSQKVNEKMSRLALASALAKKLADNELKIVNTLSLETPKTKKAAQIIHNLTSDKSALVVLANDNAKSAAALRNLKNVSVESAKNTSVRMIMSHPRILIEEKALADLAK